MAPFLAQPLTHVLAGRALLAKCATSDHKPACMQVVGPGSVPVGMHSCTLSPPQPLDLSAAEQHTLDRFRDILEAWGWRWQLPEGTSANSGTGNFATGARLTHAAVVLGTPLNGVELQV